MMWRVVAAFFVVAAAASLLTVAPAGPVLADHPGEPAGGHHTYRRTGWTATQSPNPTVVTKAIYEHWNTWTCDRSKGSCVKTGINGGAQGTDGQTVYTNCRGTRDAIPRQTGCGHSSTNGWGWGGHPSQTPDGVALTDGDRVISQATYRVSYTCTDGTTTRTLTFTDTLTAAAAAAAEHCGEWIRTSCPEGERLVGNACEDTEEEEDPPPGGDGPPPSDPPPPTPTPVPREGPGNCPAGSQWSGTWNRCIKQCPDGGWVTASSVCRQGPADNTYRHPCGYVSDLEASILSAAEAAGLIPTQARHRYSRSRGLDWRYTAQMAALHDNWWPTGLARGADKTPAGVRVGESFDLGPAPGPGASSDTARPNRHPVTVDNAGASGNLSRVCGWVEVSRTIGAPTTCTMAPHTRYWQPAASLTLERHLTGTRRTWSNQQGRYVTVSTPAEWRAASLSYQPGGSYRCGDDSDQLSHRYRDTSASASAPNPPATAHIKVSYSYRITYEKSYRGAARDHYCSTTRRRASCYTNRHVTLAVPALSPCHSHGSVAQIRARLAGSTAAGSLIPVPEMRGLVGHWWTKWIPSVDKTGEVYTDNKFDTGGGRFGATFHIRPPSAPKWDDTARHPGITVANTVDGHGCGSARYHLSEVEWSVGQHPADGGGYEFRPVRPVPPNPREGQMTPGFAVGDAVTTVNGRRCARETTNIDMGGLTFWWHRLVHTADRGICTGLFWLHADAKTGCPRNPDRQISVWARARWNVVITPHPSSGATTPRTVLARRPSGVSAQGTASSAQHSPDNCPAVRVSAAL